jgi:hypothetical protein
MRIISSCVYSLPDKICRFEKGVAYDADRQFEPNRHLSHVGDKGILGFALIGDISPDRDLVVNSP